MTALSVLYIFSLTLLFTIASQLSFRKRVCDKTAIRLLAGYFWLYGYSLLIGYFIVFGHSVYNAHLMRTGHLTLRLCLFFLHPICTTGAPSSKQV
jgi:hypothetical protein